MTAVMMKGSQFFTTVLFFLLLISGYEAQPWYSNVTLRANNGNLSAVIFLPHGIKPNEQTYYMSTRFDHSSMIGEITRTTYHVDETDGTTKSETHVLYGNKQWRVPHDPYWTESGIGLASEFGVGDDGSFCNYRCGWYQINEVTNGVLGYQTAKLGESFLKIGVGELIKGSCVACDSTEDFKFNSPYAFAKTPVWTLEEFPDQNMIALQNEAVVDANGYRLRKEVTLNQDELLVKSILTNIGRIPFATAWYSHHFFTCDAMPVGKGYGIDLDLTGTGGDYEEPGTWFWSTPIKRYAKITATPEKVSFDMERGVERDVRIKAEFTKDETTHGGFNIRGCGTSIKETIPEVGTDGGVSMYAFNLYIETGTFSPEPQIYMHLWPGQTISWTQKLEFSDLDQTGNPPQPSTSFRYYGLKALASLTSTPTSLVSLTDGSSFAVLLFAVSAIAISYSMHMVWRRRRRQISYSPIPDQ